MKFVSLISIGCLFSAIVVMTTTAIAAKIIALTLVVCASALLGYTAAVVRAVKSESPRTYKEILQTLDDTFFPSHCYT